MTSNVRAGCIKELVKTNKTTSGEDPLWVIIDIGFSGRGRSCGITINGKEIPDPIAGYRSASQASTKLGDKHYGMLCPAITEWLESTKKPSCYPALNLMIEAPLSMAFARRGEPDCQLESATQGNPIARIPDQLEETDGNGQVHRKLRLWYTQPAAGLMIASMRLVQELSAALQDWKIRLFEGFVSFKTGQETGGHWEDTCKLWNALPTATTALLNLQGPIVGSEDGYAASITTLMGGASDGKIPPILRVTDSGHPQVFAQGTGA